MKRAMLFAALVLCLVTAGPAAAQNKKAAKKAEPATPPVKVLIITGGCCHDYPTQVKLLRDGLTARANVQVDFTLQGGSTTDTAISIYNSPTWSKGYDVVLHDECFANVKDKAFVDNILQPHRDGLAAVNLHCAMHCYRVDFDTYRDWFNFVGVDSRAHGPQEPIDIKFTDNSHPITKGMADWTTIKEELYNNVNLVPTAHQLARGVQKFTDRKTGQPAVAEAMIIWTNEFGPKKTRVFSTTLGHNNETVGDSRYLDLVTRGLLWTVGKLNDDGTPAKGYGPGGK